MFSAHSAFFRHIRSQKLASRRLFSTNKQLKMKVVPVPVRSDNYAYLLIDDSTKQAAVVDPYDMDAVQAAANNEDVDIVANLTTHHHFDHSGGNKACSLSILMMYCTNHSNDNTAQSRIL